MLILAALLNFANSVLHVAIVVIGLEAYLYFGAGLEFASAEADGDLWPHAVTLVLAGMFSIWGLICLSYTGVLPRLSLVGWGVPAIAAKDSFSLPSPFVLGSSTSMDGLKRARNGGKHLKNPTNPL